MSDDFDLEDREQIDHAGSQSSDTGSPEAALRPRQLRDIIHDLIELGPRLCRFIDTPQFQRLRDIKQLGTSNYVWPSASHSRFEHCIGVAHLAGTLARNIQRAQPKLKISDRDVECVELAGLCHDLGHGPWSHMWDRMFIPDVLPEEDWTHEQGSEMMLDFLVKDNNIEIAEKDLAFIKALILGKPEECSPDEKPFLFDIVANGRNGLDVDKYDYILRDSHMFGDPVGINVARLLASARVIGREITYDIKDLNTIKEIFRTRYKLHEHYYNHKTGKIIEYMILDALKIADPHLNIAKRIRDPQQYLRLTDFIMHEIKCSSHSELDGARRLFSRIEKRDLYKMVDWKLIPYETSTVFKRHVTSLGIYQAIQDEPLVSLKVDEEELEAGDIIVEFTTLHHGMKERNPLDSVKFYSKYSPDVCYQAQPGDYSTIMPKSFAEVMMRVYTKKPQFFGVIQAGYRTILHKIPDDIDIDHNYGTSSIGETTIATPPATEAPSSPRTDSVETLPGSSTGTRSIKPLSKKGSELNRFMTVNPSYAPSSPSKTPNVSRKRKASLDREMSPVEAIQGRRGKVSEENVRPLVFGLKKRKVDDDGGEERE
ncbi:hypothetical protein AAF712_009060 [Marasmius tenuissimus]|uniref:HD/PDEase domain-containing protein n=1 Tax=Marasmius tenuissimus TaxID=585030 RepID=A0ABR2ZQN2_9AGAR